MSDDTPQKKGNKQKAKRPFYAKLFILLWIFLFLGILSVGLIFTAAAKGWAGFAELPPYQQLENPESELASEIYSSDGKLLGKFFRTNRTNAEYEELPEHLLQALIATEDRRYLKHSGIDFWALPRMIWKTVLRGDKSGGGGSTISQQLALNLFNERARGVKDRVKQKLQEWILATKLERQYTKKEIITMYLNTVPFSHNAHGIKAAAKTYFNKQPSQLNIQEGATLVGMLKASTYYNPKRNPKESRERRNTVINQMVKYSTFDPAAADSIKALPIVLEFNPSDHDRGLATYFREYLRSNLRKEWAPKNKKVDGSTYDVERDGLRIYTTIDSRMQQYAEEAVQKHMKHLQGQFYKDWKTKAPWHDDDKLIPRAMKRSERWRAMLASGKSESEIKRAFDKKVPMKLFSWEGEIDTTMSPLDSLKYVKYFLHTGFLALEPGSGDVKAWVGGINYSHFKYDNVRPTSKRQVGSTFKPFVYTVAMQSGHSMCEKVDNIKVCFERGEHGASDRWCPDNAGGGKLEGKSITLKKGLANSVNRITASLLKDFGPGPVIELVRNMGIESHIEPVPSICLGSADISVFEMVGSYGTFANEGVFTQPNFIDRIEDKNGQVIYQPVAKQTQVLNPHTAYTMLQLLQGVTNQGTGIRLRTRYKLEAEIAGKTGTTNDHSDGWYIGIVPDMVAGAWVGGDEKGVHFPGLARGSGANMALPIWAEFMQRVYRDRSLEFDSLAAFDRPAGSSKIIIDCDKFIVPDEELEVPDSPFIDAQPKEYEFGDEFN